MEYQVIILYRVLTQGNLFGKRTDKQMMQSRTYNNMPQVKPVGFVTVSSQREGKSRCGAEDYKKSMHMKKDEYGYFQPAKPDQ